MISAKKLSDLLAALYAVPLEEEHWPVFLTTLCKQLEALQCFYMAASATQPIGVRAQGGPPLDMEGPQRYNDYYHRSDPYSIAFPRKPRIGPIFAEELVAREELERSEFYQCQATANGMHHAMFLPAILAPDRLELVTIWRSLQQKPFDAESVQLLNLLLPHIQSALRTQHVLAASTARAGRAESVLDTVAAAAFILNGRGRIVHQNLAAESLLRLQDGLGAREKQLYAAEPLIHGKLQALIASAAAASGATLCQPGGVIGLPRPSGKRSFQVMVLPLRLPGAFVAAHVLVLVGDPDQAPNFSEAVLGGFYGLTRAEVEIANALLSGRTVEQIADKRGVTDGTLRVQLKTIFQKTDTRRQSDLLKLLLSLPASSARTGRMT
ncbi:MAG TPA: hypothetical protein VHX52_06195 [Steroidobacteraceae bacterium]|jgi:DNA-binding CsgD family transcriptional regulator/PAS domain-containing protein|nr:hypothetical protein [Steroidobacteraceae bacterium]